MSYGAEQPKRPVIIPEAYQSLFWPHMPDGTPIRYRVFFGGRGAGKSYNLARALVAEAYSTRHLVLCTRQFQNSIVDSVYRVVERCIYDLGLMPWFELTRNSIYCPRSGSEFIFKGLERNINEIRSLEGVTRCWLEEANSTRFDSWMILDPTIRAPGSQIWISYNPEHEDDPIHRKFVIDEPPHNALVKKTSWRDNPWFVNTELHALRLEWIDKYPDTYDWVWEGECRRISEAAIFRNTFDVEAFDTPIDVDRLYFGADWGFANDPSVLIRCWIQDEVLYVDYEAYEVGIEIDDLPALFAGGVAAKTGVSYPGVPGCLDWPIFADSARPETISYLARREPGFPIYPADKWQGCVEDGIAHLKAFKRIKIHPRCERTAREFRLYSYATDPRNTQIILPKIVDKHNHCLVGDTKVAVLRGLADIRCINAGDFVNTREGLREVLWSGVSATDSTVLSMITGDGRVITGTPDHRVYTTRGFIRMAEILADDNLWLDDQEALIPFTRRLTRSLTTAVFTAATRMQKGQTQDTLSLSPVWIQSSFTGRFGWTATGLFLTALMSIIRMRIRSITTCLTLIAYRTKIIWHSILGQSSDWLDSAQFWTGPDWLLARGIDQKPDVNGTLPTLLPPTGQSPLRKYVATAARRSSIRRSDRTVDGVLSPARLPAVASKPSAGSAEESSGIILPSLTKRVPRYAERSSDAQLPEPYCLRSNALGATSHSSQERQKTGFAASRVLAIVNGMNAREVYDLTVDQEHEFFANGILVHNCIDSLRYALNSFVKQRGNLGVWGRLAS